MAYRSATGRPMKVPAMPVTARDHLRYHLRRKGMHITHLAKAWNVGKTSAYRIMYCKKRRLTPNYIEAAIELLGMDELDANKLRLIAAREAGWLMELKYLRLIY